MILSALWWLGTPLGSWIGTTLIENTVLLLPFSEIKIRCRKSYYVDNNNSISATTAIRLEERTATAKRVKTVSAAVNVIAISWFFSSCNIFFGFVFGKKKKRRSIRWPEAESYMYICGLAFFPSQIRRSDFMFPTLPGQPIYDCHLNIIPRQRFHTWDRRNKTVQQHYSNRLLKRFFPSLSRR